jgi:hypothetical protein
MGGGREQVPQAPADDAPDGQVLRRVARVDAVAELRGGEVHAVGLVGELAAVHVPAERAGEQHPGRVDALELDVADVRVEADRELERVLLVGVRRRVDDRQVRDCRCPC